MRLSPKEIDKLMLHNAGFLAQKRLWRGVRLNYPEAVALIASQVMEFIRDGDSVATLMDKGKQLLGMSDVLPQVPQMLDEVQIEGTFPDGVKLVTVHHPVCQELGDKALALYGSGLSLADATLPTQTEETVDTPGEIVPLEGQIVLSEGAETCTLSVTNTGDRPIQVGSHYPFFEVNPALEFERDQAYGFRLDIPSGTAVRFEPGDEKEVNLVKIRGEQTVYGGNGFISGKLSPENKVKAMNAFERACGAETGDTK
jgi:urease subunit gamma/beta